MGEFETHYATLRTIEYNAPEVALVLAHNDDEKMLNLEASLAAQGVIVKRIVLTNGDGNGRVLHDYTQAELPKRRWAEGIASGKNSGITSMHRFDSPDGYLCSYIDVAVEFAAPLVTDAIAIFTPNEKDKHPDHRGANQVALKVAGSSIPVYEMDTLDGLDREGVPLENGIYIPLTRKRARQERRGYLLNTSQTANIPIAQRRDMFDAIAMTKRRGAEIGMRHAAIVFPTYNAVSNPLPDMIEVYTKPRYTSSVI